MKMENNKKIQGEKQMKIKDFFNLKGLLWGVSISYLIGVIILLFIGGVDRILLFVSTLTCLGLFIGMVINGMFEEEIKGEKE